MNLWSVPTNPGRPMVSALSMKQEHQVAPSAVVAFMCACSGTRSDVLARAPQYRSQAATLGLLLVLTATVACGTSGYALYGAFLGSPFVAPLAVVGGLIWGMIIFSIDRLLISGIDKFAPPWKVALQVITRLPLALIIAQVMSTPLILRLCATVLDGELRVQQQQRLSNESEANESAAELGRIREQLSELKGQIKDEQQRLQGKPDSPEYRLAYAARDNARAKHAAVKAKNDENIRLALLELKPIEFEDDEEVEADEDVSSSDRSREG